MERISYNLQENAYSFINESILNSSKAKRESKYWAFAILHIIQALELLVKQVLRNEHEVLIYENIDNKKNTVTLAAGLERLKNISNIHIDEKEKSMIMKATKYRNLIIHFEYELNSKQFQDIYVHLFEFVHYFHRKHLNSELHSFIEKKLWKAEAQLLDCFKSSSIFYRGAEIHPSWPLEILEAQKYNAVAYLQNGKEVYYQRIKFGSQEWEFDREYCDDCGVIHGEYHADGCDVELCPICGEQFLCCGHSMNICGIENNLLIKKY